MSFELKLENQNHASNRDLFYFSKNAKHLLSNFEEKDLQEVAELKLGASPSIFGKSENLRISGNRTVYEIKASKDYLATLGTRLIPNTCELPVDESSLDLALQAYLFNRVRMDQVYMICAELRRSVKKGGYWGILEHSFGSGILSKGISGVWGRWMQHNLLDINHYISPEDWEIHSQEYLSNFGISSQIMILKRI